LYIGDLYEIIIITPSINNIADTVLHTLNRKTANINVKKTYQFKTP